MVIDSPGLRRHALSTFSKPVRLKDYAPILPPVICPCLNVVDFCRGFAFLVSIALILGSLVPPILGIDSSSTTSESRVTKVYLQICSPRIVYEDAPGAV
jgi:hypothetical protein